MAKTTRRVRKVTNLAFTNFSAHLNMLFNDELILSKQYCRGLNELSEVYNVRHDRQNDKVILSGNPTASVGAKYEVAQVAKMLAKRYLIPLEIN